MADSADGLKGSKDKKNNLWSEILSEVSEQTTKKIPSNKRLLVLGDDVTGKTTLISKLRSPGEAEIKKGSGLEYTYVDVHDVELDQHTRLSVWILDGDPYHKGLLKYSFAGDTARNVFVLIVVDMSRPWTIMDSLERWTRILTEHLHSLKMTSKDLNEMEGELVREYQSYIDPEEATDEAKHGRSQPHAQKDEQAIILPLEGNILATNLGIPIAVVCTKTDAMSNLEKENDFKEEHFDFIQRHIRSFCLRYGAALLYTSVKEGRNVSLLYNYLLHRIYGFPLKQFPQVVEKDALFIPMGWDNEKKIGILDEHIKSFSPTDQFDEHITKPVQRKAGNQEKEVIAEDEQDFLAAQEINLSKAPSPSAASSLQRPQQEHMRSRMQQPGQRLAAKAGGIPLAGKPKLEGAKLPGGTANAGEGVLANFFNSLLNKKSTGKAPAAGSSPSDRAAYRSDAAAELERMSRVKKEAATKKEGESTP